MNDRRMTNVLLLLIFLALVSNMLFRLFSAPLAHAETFKLDDCITKSWFDKPAAYLHVVPHKAPTE